MSSLPDDDRGDDAEPVAPVTDLPPLAQVDCDITDLEACVAWWLRREAEGTLTGELASQMLHGQTDAMAFLRRLAAAQKARDAKR